MALQSAPFSESGLAVFFQSQRCGIDGKIVDQLVAFIAGAHQSLEVAIYDLKEPRVLEALQERSGKVRLHIRYDDGPAAKVGGASRTVDPKPTQEKTTGDLLAEHGLQTFSEPVHDHGRHLMHNKFIVRDGKTVWTGSGNFTHGGLVLQDNNFLIFDSVPLATTYRAAFSELTIVGHPPRAGQPVSAAAGDWRASVRFSTQLREHEEIEATVIAQLRNSHKVRIMAMLISDPGILAALKTLHDNGADLAGILDPHEMKQVMKPPRGRDKSNDPEFWFAQGDPNFVAAPTHAFHQGDTNDFMHNKVMIIDDHTVITGSYNFSENAELNDENLLVIQSPKVAKAYTSYFEHMFEHYKKDGAHLPPE